MQAADVGELLFHKSAFQFGPLYQEVKRTLGTREDWHHCAQNWVLIAFIFGGKKLGHASKRRFTPGRFLKPPGGTVGKRRAKKAPWGEPLLKVASAKTHFVRAAGRKIPPLGRAPSCLFPLAGLWSTKCPVSRKKKIPPLVGEERLPDTEKYTPAGGEEKPPKGVTHPVNGG